MPSAKFTSVNVVVAEVTIADTAVFVSNEAVLIDDRLIELHLDLGVHRRGNQGRGQLVREQALGFLDGVHVAEESVALVGELLHRRVVEAV